MQVSFRTGKLKGCYYMAGILNSKYDWLICGHMALDKSGNAAAVSRREQNYTQICSAYIPVEIINQ
jgi:hypothetical protein